MMRNILITGGAGFIGARLCEKLYQKGYQITVLDNLSSQVHAGLDSSLLNRVKDISTFIKGDIRSKSDCKKAIKGQDIIVHLAAETGTAQSMYELERYNDVNIMGTARLLDVLSNSDYSVKKIVVASSRAIYGEGKYNCLEHGEQYPSFRSEKDMQNGKFNPRCKVCDREMKPMPTDEGSRLFPLSMYGINKHQQEQMVMLMAKSLKISAVALRYQNVYGPGQSLINPYTGILSIFSTRILNNNSLDIYEDGLESRDFVYIEDVINATILGIEKEEANGEIFNVGSGVATTVQEVAERLKILYESNIDIIINGRFRLPDIRHNFADLSKIKRVLGFIPKYDFQQGITEFVSWVKTQGIMKDKYDDSIKELREKGLMR